MGRKTKLSPRPIEGSDRDAEFKNALIGRRLEVIEVCRSLMERVKKLLESDPGAGKRFVDLTTDDRELALAEIEFMQAMLDFTPTRDQTIPTWSELYDMCLSSSCYQVEAFTPDAKDPVEYMPESALKSLAMMTGLSERLIRAWEGQCSIEGHVSQLLNEMHRLWLLLTEVVNPESVPRWLEAPNVELEGLTPIEVLRRGESDRIRTLIFYLGSGMPT